MDLENNPNTKLGTSGAADSGDNTLHDIFKPRSDDDAEMTVIRPAQPMADGGDTTLFAVTSPETTMPDVVSAPPAEADIISVPPAPGAIAMPPPPTAKPRPARRELPTRKRSRRGLWLGILLVLLAAIGGGLWFFLVGPGKAAETATAQTVSYPITRTIISGSVSATGSLAAANDLNLAFQSGGTLTKVYVKPGR